MRGLQIRVGLEEAVAQPVLLQRLDLDPVLGADRHTLAP
jgi:hypothetical protein